MTDKTLEPVEIDLYTLANSISRFIGEQQVDVQTVSFALVLLLENCRIQMELQKSPFWDGINEAVLSEKIHTIVQFLDRKEIN